MLCSSIYINTRVQADPKGFAVVRVKKKYKLSRAEQKMKVMLWNMAQDYLSTGAQLKLTCL